MSVHRLSSCLLIAALLALVGTALDVKAPDYKTLVAEIAANGKVRDRNPPLSDSEIACANLTANVTFSASCAAKPDGFHDPTCWSPNSPGEYDIAEIPQNIAAMLAPNSNNGSDPKPFSVISVGSLIIAQGASLTMEGRAIQAKQCFVVSGVLIMLPSTPLSNVTNEGPVAGTPYLADPSQPENTDCLLVNTGFLPRICGPGQMIISSGGSVSLGEYYSSLFIETTVQTGGTLTVNNHGFVWGVVTNKGTFSTTGYVYMHGYLYNYGSASLMAVAFDKWATSFVESPPLLIQNYGDLTFRRTVHATVATYYTPSGAIASSGVYKAAVMNYEDVTFSVDINGNSGASTDFDLFNFGNAYWKNSQGSNEYTTNWGGMGNYVNHGVFSANSVAVYLSTYHSVGGMMSHHNEGSFTFGNGAVNPRTVKLCTMQQSHRKKMESRPLKPKREDMVQERDGCWWYGDFCYHTPYLFQPPSLNDIEKTHRHFTAPKHSIAIQLSRVINSMAIPSPCTQRYSFSGVSSFSGDGTGSIVSTLPVFVEGTVKVKKGARWYAMTENGNPPVWGGGKVFVGEAGEMYLGIEANFNHDGTLIVSRGGRLAVPKHSRIQVSNHTIEVRKGGIFHIDGRLTTNVLSKPIKNCGELRGNGRVVKSKEDDLDC